MEYHHFLERLSTVPQESTSKIQYCRESDGLDNTTNLLAGSTFQEDVPSSSGRYKVIVLRSSLPGSPGLVLFVGFYHTLSSIYEH